MTDIETKPKRTREELKAKGFAHEYDLDDPEEVIRLYRECAGYLRTCQGKHGTDFEGRKFAMDALESMIRRQNMLRRLGAAQR